jgi:hypothetical protein
MIPKANDLFVFSRFSMVFSVFFDQEDVGRLPDLPRLEPDQPPRRPQWFRRHCGHHPGPSQHRHQLPAPVMTVMALWVMALCLLCLSCGIDIMSLEW